MELFFDKSEDIQSGEFIEWTVVKCGLEDAHLEMKIFLDRPIVKLTIREVTLAVKSSQSYCLTLHIEAGEEEEEVQVYGGSLSELLILVEEMDGHTLMSYFTSPYWTEIGA